MPDVTKTAMETMEPPTKNTALATITDQASQAQADRESWRARTPEERP
jgi:hypothetical protein